MALAQQQHQQTVDQIPRKTENVKYFAQLTTEGSKKSQKWVTFFKHCVTSHAGNGQNAKYHYK